MRISNAARQNIAREVDAAVAEFAADFIPVPEPPAAPVAAPPAPPVVKWYAEGTWNGFVQLRCRFCTMTQLVYPQLSRGNAEALLFKHVADRHPSELEALNGDKNQ